VQPFWLEDQMTPCIEWREFIAMLGGEAAPILASVQQQALPVIVPQQRAVPALCAPCRKFRTLSVGQGPIGLALGMLSKLELSRCVLAPG
jgi:hypothetical protein